MGEIIISGGASGAGSDDCTATADKILAGYTAIVNNGTDEPTTGTMATKNAGTYNTSASDQTISANQYLLGAQTIKAVTVSGLDASKMLTTATVKVGDANDDDRIASATGTIVTKTDSGNVTLNAGTTSKSYPAGYYPNAHGAVVTVYAGD